MTTHLNLQIRLPRLMTGLLKSNPNAVLQTYYRDEVFHISVIDLEPGELDPENEEEDDFQ